MASHSLLLSLIISAALCGAAMCQQSGLVPANPQPRTDKQGNEWYVEQNGQLSRHSGGNSILSGAMTLILGTEQFYCNQPMATPDGKELVLMGSQPMQGLQVTRNIRFLEKEGGMRYLEMITNSTGNDITTNLELRNNFSGQVKGFLTNTARPVKGGLEKDETSVLALPGTANYNTYLFTVCGPRSGIKPRVTTQTQYQLSFFFNITVPAGKTIALLHTVTQDKVSLRPDLAELEKILKPFALSRNLRELPKGSAALLVNLRAGSVGALDLAAWFPDEILGIKRESTDVLAMGEGTRLRGRASCAKLTLEHSFGTAIIPWEQVMAVTGGRFEGGDSRVYLSDGQVLRGSVKAEELQFILSTGLSMALKVEELDRLVLASSGPVTEWPKQVSALVEMTHGERFSLRDSAAVPATIATSWGTREIVLGDLLAISSVAEDSFTPVVLLKDGSRLRVWLAGQGSLAVTTSLFGAQNLESTRIRALAVGGAASSESGGDDEGEPKVAFADLAGEQRLVAPLAGAQIQIVTTGGVVPLEPSSLKEMRNVTEDIQMPGVDDSPWFQIELWGGGTVLGQLRESVLHFQVGGGEWIIPSREVTRLINPVPKIADTTLNRMAQLIRELGNDEWKVREKASGELRNLGEIARSALQEAFKQSEDAEVKHRIEDLLGELD